MSVLRLEQRPADWLLVLATFAIVTTTIAHGTAPVSHLMNRHFIPAEIKYQIGAWYRREVSQSAVLCVRDCHADPGCLSVNYHMTEQICELNNGSRQLYPDDFITRYGSVYFDADEDTPLHSVSGYSSCMEILEAGHGVSGVYTIFPAGFHTNGLQVYCDMDNGGGGWMVIQRREDGDVDFYRNWTDFQGGFGSLPGDFWIGNEVLRDLTETGTWHLRIDMEGWGNEKIYAEYGEFQISGHNYQLTVGSYDDSSTAGDALTIKHNGRLFSTKDKDNDNLLTDSCAIDNQRAWWYDRCYQSNLNGKFFGYLVTNVKSIRWRTWNELQSLRKMSMKIRPSPQTEDLDENEFVPDD